MWHDIGSLNSGTSDKDKALNLVTVVLLVPDTLITQESSADQWMTFNMTSRLARLLQQYMYWVLANQQMKSRRRVQWAFIKYIQSYNMANTQCDSVRLPIDRSKFMISTTTMQRLQIFFTWLSTTCKYILYHEIETVAGTAPFHQPISRVERA